MSGHTPWSQIRRKAKLPLGPVNAAYWRAMREGSHFEVPSFPPSMILSQFPLATGKSKKLYEKALATAFRRARSYRTHPAVARKVGPGMSAFRRLLERCDEN